MVTVAWVSMATVAWVQHTLPAHILEEQEIEIRKEVSKPTPNNSLPPARLCLLKVSQPSKRVPSAGDQVFKLVYGDILI